MDDRELAIRVGQASNLAYQYAFLSGSVSSIEDATELVKEIVPHLVDSLNIIQASMAFNHAAATPAGVTPISQAPSYQGVDPSADQFPTEAERRTSHHPPSPNHPSVAPQQQYQPAQQQVPQIPGAQGTQPGGSKTDQKWLDYFNNPGAYYDNRVDKRNPASPDFKHRQTGDGLWLSGKYPAPAWVLQRLGGAQPQQQYAPGTEPF